MKKTVCIESLLSDLGAGKQSALNALYELYVNKVYGFVFKLVHDKEEAEDIVQNLFLRIWENRAIVSKVDSFDRYLFKMAKNAVFDSFDHKVIKAKFERNTKKQFSYDDSLEDKISASNLELLIAIEIEKMPVQRKKIFKMSREEGYSNNDIASITGLSLNTIESHMSLALKDLRKAMAMFL